MAPRADVPPGRNGLADECDRSTSLYCHIAIAVAVRRPTFGSSFGPNASGLPMYSLKDYR
jgi:hypothetical protein